MEILKEICFIAKDAMLTMLIVAAASNVLEKGRTKWFLMMFVIIAILL